jgi:hypothetical protein
MTAPHLVLRLRIVTVDSACVVEWRAAGSGNRQSGAMARTMRIARIMVGLLLALIGLAGVPEDLKT